MKIGRKRGWLLAAVAAAASCVLQIIGLSRYLGRLPEDPVGIGLYIADNSARANKKWYDDVVAAGSYIGPRAAAVKDGK